MLDPTAIARCRDCGNMVDIQNGRYDKHGECPGWFARVDDEEGWRLHLESRFTAPRPDCPHPERWHSADADSTEKEVTNLVAAFVFALRCEIAVETGAAWGQTSVRIGESLIGHGGHLHTIEPNPERALFVRAGCAGLPVTVHETTSLEWDPVDNIGFAWLDSLHHLRVPEFRAFYPHFAPGAFVGFHDTGPHQGSLRDEILELETAGMLLPIFLPTPRGLALCEVVPGA